MSRRYPQDISEEESDLGFRRLEIDCIGNRWQPEFVVCRVLSSSDVLVKTLDEDGRIRYSHRRWGYYKSIGNRSLPNWMPIIDPYEWAEAQKVIQEFDFGGAKETLEGDSVGMPFTYREAS